MRRLFLAVVFAVAFHPALALAQCLNWSTQFSQTGPGGQVLALLSHDDGSGPALFVGGGFNPNIVKWNGTAWTPLGSGTDDAVTALASWDDGSGPALFVGGVFLNAGGTLAPGIARWNGSSWANVGVGLWGLGHGALAFAVYDDGSGPALFVGGSFVTAGGTATSTSIAKWDGTTWSSLGSGMGGGGTYGPVVRALAVYNDGNGRALYAGGQFTTAGSVSANYIAKWDGTSWSALGSGTENEIDALVVFDDGTGPALYAGPGGGHAGGIPTFGIAKWNGTSWSSVGNGPNGAAEALCVFDDGTGPGLYAAGSIFTIGGMTARHIARWDGTRWSALGAGLNSWVYALAVHNDGQDSAPDLYAGGNLTQAGAIPSIHVAEWHGCAGNVNSFCFGDGTVAACPCSNTGNSLRGCKNSSTNSLGALLRSTGNPALGNDTLVFHATDELPSSLTIFFQGNAFVSTSANFGDGLRCAGGSLKRLYVKNASGGAVSAPDVADSSVHTRSAALGDSILPGTIRYYQTYYRDPDPSFCPTPSGNTFNSTNGMIIVWH